MTMAARSPAHDVVDRTPDRVFDVDTHVSEPADLWTSRLGGRWGDAAPHVRFDEETRRERWVVGDHLLTGIARHATAGWSEPYPSSPPSLEDAHPAASDPVERLRFMDHEGITAAIIYPNLLGFQVWAFLKLEPELRLDVVRAFNEWQVEFCSVAPHRLMAHAYLPFWDIDASVTELRRCIELGYRGILFGTRPERLGLPRMSDPHWEPLLALLQEARMSVNIHVAFADRPEAEITSQLTMPDMRDMAKETALSLMGNGAGIAEVIMSGVCEAYPDLKFVSVESGFGYVPYMLEALDWQFLNMGVREQFPSMSLPSEIFRRQVYATFWFESDIDRLADLYPDNLMFETDFPHPSGVTVPQQGAVAPGTQALIAAHLADVPDDIRRKILFDNAAQLYGLAS
jgi:predicted TIM-barrel fold metal-dependent hydrolase